MNIKQSERSVAVDQRFTLGWRFNSLPQQQLHVMVDEITITTMMHTNETMANKKLKDECYQEENEHCNTEALSRIGIV